MIEKPKTINGLELWHCPELRLRMTERQCRFNRGIVKESNRKQRPESRALGVLGVSRTDKHKLTPDELEIRRQVCTGCPGVRGLAQGKVKAEPKVLDKPKGTGMKECGWCRRVFEGVSTAKWCSNKCRNARRHSKLATRPCVICKQPFDSRGSGRTRTCSHDCKLDLTLITRRAKAT